MTRTFMVVERCSALHCSAIVYGERLSMFRNYWVTQRARQDLNVQKIMRTDIAVRHNRSENQGQSEARRWFVRKFACLIVNRFILTENSSIRYETKLEADILINVSLHNRSSAIFLRPLELWSPSRTLVRQNDWYNQAINPEWLYSFPYIVM